jgi:hypothetical protein
MRKKNHCAVQWTEVVSTTAPYQRCLWSRWLSPRLLMPLLAICSAVSVLKVRYQTLKGCWINRKIAGCVLTCFKSVENVSEGFFKVWDLNCENRFLSCSWFFNRFYRNFVSSVDSMSNSYFILSVSFCCKTRIVNEISYHLGQRKAKLESMEKFTVCVFMAAISYP